MIFRGHRPVVRDEVNGKTLFNVAGSTVWGKFPLKCYENLL